MSRRDLIVSELVMLLLLALVLVVEWWRNGELEQLNVRVDELEHARRRSGTRKSSEVNGQ